MFLSGVDHIQAVVSSTINATSNTYESNESIKVCHLSHMVESINVIDTTNV